MATVEFAPLEAAEASGWLAERGLERKLDSPATIAELHAMLAGSLSVAAAPAPVGFA
jgi:ABC-type nitrate/sulfonate/bicarbonate transport system substrate-binding protein